MPRPPEETAHTARVTGTRIAVDARTNEATLAGWVPLRMGGPGSYRSRDALAPAVAADTVVWLATLPRGGTSGGFFIERRPIPW